MKKLDEIARSIAENVSTALTEAAWAMEGDGATKAETPTFMSQCMDHEVNEKGTPQKQAVAICLSMKSKYGDTAADWDKYKANKKPK